MERRTLLLRQLACLEIEVEEAVPDRLLLLLDELLRWNRRVNLTAITDPAEGVEKHLVDSLTVLPLLSGAERLLDLGSGGGFPAIPLKLALPELSVVSVDAVGKKIAFQRHAARLLHLDGFEPIHERAESLPEKRGYSAGFDVVVSRAFTSLESFARLALPCLAADGKIIAMKGAEGERELSESRAGLEFLGLACTVLKRLSLPSSGAGRVLIVLQRRNL